MVGRSWIPANTNPPPLNLFLQLPLMLSTLNHFIDRRFCNLHCMCTDWNAAIDHCLKHDLPDLHLGKSVPQSPLGVYGEFSPALQSREKCDV